VNEESSSPGLYIHVPFCSHRCAYCDFATDLESAGEREIYLERLFQEIDQKVEYLRNRGLSTKLDTLYFGGGTPSLLEIEEMGRILSRVRSRFTLDPRAEVTLEANPESVTALRLKGWKDLGVNRVSVGIQSLSDRELKFLGRRHLRAQNLIALEALANSGLRWNADLMVGLPAQSKESFEASVEGILQFDCKHISVYMLSIEEGAPWYEAVHSGQIELAADDLTVDLYNLLRAKLSSWGLEQYEISAFCVPGEESRHNLKYWQNDAYLGIGPSAGSWLFPHRFQNEKSLKGWVSQIQEEVLSKDFEELCAKNAFLESVMLQFRLVRGIPEDWLMAGDKTFPELKLESRLKRLQERSLLVKMDSVYRLSEQGLLFANEVFMEFMD